MSLFDAFRNLTSIWFGKVWPERPERPLPDLDPRTHAMRTFRKFLSQIDMQKTGNEHGPPISFRIDEKDIFDVQPPDPENLDFPSISVVSSRGTHDAYALGPADLDERTRDRWGKGSALLHFGEFQEQLTIEAWASNQAERRAVLTSIRTALRLSQRSQAVVLEIPEYYCQRASFLLLESQYVDDPDVIRGRNRGQLIVEMRVPEVVLVDVVTLKPYVEVEVIDAGTAEVC